MNYFPVQALQYQQCIEIRCIIPFRHFKCTATVPVDNSTTNNIIKMRWCFIWSSCLSDIRLYMAHSSECKNIKNILFFPLKFLTDDYQADSFAAGHRQHAMTWSVKITSSNYMEPNKISAGITKPLGAIAWRVYKLITNVWADSGEIWTPITS